MTPLITIGTYLLTDFVRLNIIACRSIFPDSPILLSDDRSPASCEIEALAEEFDCFYSCSHRRRTHVSGDWQAFINGALLAEDQWVLKLSQRFIPATPIFRDKLRLEFGNFSSTVNAFLPGKMDPIQIARPGARFYRRFGHLTDCVLFNPKVFTPAVLKTAYDAGYGTGQKGDLFSELAWDRLMAVHPCKKLDWLANYEPMKPKPYLRKACCTSAEYQALADELGTTGQWDVREWKSIEGAAYRSVPA